jgi:hypothetical protein
MSSGRTTALSDALCNDIASGMSIKAACEHIGIARHEFYSWQLADEEFSTRIARAREKQQDALVDDMRDIADSATPEDWQVKRLQIWQRQWEASKLAPKKYGDKQQLEHSGGVTVTSIGFKGSRGPNAP